MTSYVILPDSPLHVAAKVAGLSVTALAKKLRIARHTMLAVFQGTPSSKTSKLYAGINFRHWERLGEILGVDWYRLRADQLAFYKVTDDKHMRYGTNGKRFASSQPCSPMFLLRAVKGLSQNALADKTKLGPDFISALERTGAGRSSGGAPEALTRIAKILGVDPYRFIAGMRRFARDRVLQSYLTAHGTIAGNDPMFNLLRAKCVELSEMPKHHPKRQYLMETIREISEAWELRQEERKEQMYEEIKKASGK